MIDSLVLNPQHGTAGDPNVNDEAFLPRILSIFYATFDARQQGSKIVYQVPEGSIRVSAHHPGPDSASSPTFSAKGSIRSPSFTPGSSILGATNDAVAGLGEPEPLSLSGRAHRLTSGASGGASPALSHMDLSSPTADTTTFGNTERSTNSPFFGPSYPTSGISRSRPPALTGLSSTTVASTKYTHTTPYLLDFDSISEYVIPKTKLCGRLVHCNTPKHRILGYPVILSSDRYFRRDFRYNLCFVFDRMADLSCYEPVVRKCATVLMSCEEESGFLSNPQTLPRMYSVLEQLYEDLNSYSETSIRIDSFNSIELKIFPFYPNPPKVYDWQVPIALINLAKRVEPNWDLTVARIIPFINGVNHVRKIADLADTDPTLTKKCMEHLLFYQCVLMVDIFQYSNIYSLKPSIQWLAEDAGVIAECGPYVTRPGYDLLPWPRLLKFYSYLKRGKTVHDWMEENDIAITGIDVRRFLSFGLIKGFLRRVHRYPILLSGGKGGRRKKGDQRPHSRVLKAEEVDALLGAVKDSGIGGSTNPFDLTNISASMESGSSLATLHGFRIPGRSVGMMHESGALSPSTYTPTQYFPRPRQRQGSTQSTLSAINTQHASQPYFASTAALTTSTPVPPELSSSYVGSWVSNGGPPTPAISRTNTTRHRTTSISRGGPGTGMNMMSTISLTGTGAVGGLQTDGTLEPPPYPKELPELLDGNHHTDELCSRFGMSWRELEVCLAVIGTKNSISPQLPADPNENSNKPPDLGKVKIIYR